MAELVGVDEKALAALPEAEQVELRGLLEKINAAAEANPLLTYFPHPKQEIFHSAQTSTRCFIAGNRAGKSSGGVVDDLIQLCDREALPAHLLKYKRFDPPFYMRVVTPDLGQTREVVVEKFRELTPRSQLKGGAWERAWKENNSILRFENGSRVDFMSTEQDPNKFGGKALHRVHWDEEPSGPNAEKIIAENQIRLIDYGGDEIWTFTPLLGLSYTYDKIWMRRDEPGITVVQASIHDNPHLDDEAKERILADLTEEERKMREGGEFVHMEGLVYPEFGERHLISPPTREEIQAYPVHRVSIDPGLQTTAVVFGAFDKDNRLFIFDELYLTGGSAIPENAARSIKDKEAFWGISPDFHVIDPAARVRDLINAEQLSSAYERAGISTVPGQNALEPGVFEVKRRLQHDPPALRVSTDCTHWLYERERYRIRAREDGKFDVLKKIDHLMDATRYLCQSRPWAASLTAPKRRNSGWVPGTAPAWNGHREPAVVGPMGKYS